MTTTKDEEEADRIAQNLLDNRVAACVQVFGPIRSKYWWRGKIEEAKEWVCMIKGKSSDYPKIEKLIKEIHSYEVPEILAFSISDGNKEYLKWIDGETTGKR
jgi:periplasmic divalent cation tolerance protein